MLFWFRKRVNSVEIKPTWSRLKFEQCYCLSFVCYVYVLFCSHLFFFFLFFFPSNVLIHSGVKNSEKFMWVKKPVSCTSIAQNDAFPAGKCSNGAKAENVKVVNWLLALFCLLSLIHSAFFPGSHCSENVFIVTLAWLLIEKKKKTSY